MRLLFVVPAVLAIATVQRPGGPAQSEPAAGRSAASVSSIAPMSAARAAHTATLLDDGRVLITGGFANDREGDPFAEAELFEPQTHTFTSTGPMTTGRQSHSSSLLRDGRVLVVGGYGGDAMGTSETYDPEARRFERAAGPITSRAAHRATVLDDGRVVISGGLDEHSIVLASVEIYDPQSDDFTEAGSMTTPRVGHTQTLLGDGTLLIAGGTSGRRADTRILASAEIFDPATGTSVVVARLKDARYKHAAVALVDGRVLVIGGSDERDWRGWYDSAEIYDPQTRSFSVTPKLNSPRFKLRTATTRLTDGRVLIAGGSEIVEIFDPASDAFLVVPDQLDAKWFFSTATALKDGRALIAGGYDRRIHSTRQAWIFTP